MPISTVAGVDPAFRIALLRAEIRRDAGAAYAVWDRNPSLHGSVLARALVDRTLLALGISGSDPPFGVEHFANLSHWDAGLRIPY